MQKLDICGANDRNIKAMLTQNDDERKVIQRAPIICSHKFIGRPVALFNAIV